MDLTKLPASMEELWLNFNEFSGRVDLSMLPPGMKLLFLNNNKFTALNKEWRTMTMTGNTTGKGRAGW